MAIGSAETDLAALAERAGLGDEAAFADLYDATSARVYGLAMRVMGNRTRAAVVTEQIYGDIWRSGGHEPVRGTVLAWIMAVAHRRAVASARAARETSEELPAVAEGACLGEATVSTVNGAGFSSEGHRVAAALTEMTVEQRETLRLAYFEGHTHTEISTLTGSPPGSAPSRIRDGLRLLRGQLEGR